MDTFRKTASAAAIATEVASLRWLEVAGGAPVARVVADGRTWLETAYLPSVAPTATAARTFGGLLAHTHAAGASHWGQVPPGLDPADSRLAELVQPAAAGSSSWGEWFAANRVAPYVKLARDRGALGHEESRAVDRAIAALARGKWDAPLPGLCTAPAARIHGDLWGGNVLWTAHGATLIDPAAHGGHAETDLAELAVFHTPYLDQILAGYHAASPLADGWRERIPVHQLHMLAVHVALFGTAYSGELVRLARLAS